MRSAESPERGAVGPGPPGQSRSDRPCQRRRARARRRPGLRVETPSTARPKPGVRLAPRSSRSSTPRRSSGATPPRSIMTSTSTRRSTPPEDVAAGGEHEASQSTMRNALKVSSNRAAAQLLQQIGTGTADRLRAAPRDRLGSAPVPSLALGTGEVTLLELTAAYTVFANQGMLTAPRLVTSRGGPKGAVFWSAPMTTTRALTADHGLYDVEHARGRRVEWHRDRRAGGGFHPPAGGKTGTDGRLRGRVVHRIHPAHRRRRVVRARHPPPDHGARLWRHGGGAGMGAVHEDGDQGRKAEWFSAGRSRKGRDLPAEWRAGDRRLSIRDSGEHGFRRGVCFTRRRVVAASCGVTAEPAARAERLRGLLSFGHDLIPAVPAAQRRLSEPLSARLASSPILRARL